jgi:dipeptidyl aminopeptidase/acylaminoacyl peptidase
MPTIVVATLAAMTPSFDLETFLQQPRLGGLALSQDGRRLVVGVATPAPDNKRLRTALWAIDPDGEAPARQLTRSAPGESGAAFAPDGSLLFVSARPDPDATETDEPPAALWCLPPDGGEARLVFAPQAGVEGISVAEDTGDVLVASSLHPRADSLTSDREQQKAREEAGVTAQLFTTYPIRHWDAYLGPREPARWVLESSRLGDPGPDATPTPPADDTPSDPAATEEETGARLVTRGPSLRQAEGVLTPDGSTLITGWRSTADRFTLNGPADLVTDLVAIDVATGERRTLVADGRAFGSPAVSPDGTKVVCVASDLGAPDSAAELTLVLVDLSDGSARDVAGELDLWPGSPRWLPSGDAIVFEADEAGHRPVFRVDLDDDEVTRLTASGAYTDLCPAPDGEHVFALHAEVGVPHRPVRLRADATDQEPVVLPSPVGVTPDNAKIERLVATADDGVEVGSWLVLPTDTDGPAPMVVFIHGGPLGSWNTWHWRWNPFVLADRGYAVLLPDPALSTGYGRDFIQRGWGRWGEEPYTDLMAVVEAAASHDSVDGDRVAAAGGSFGGYMANWVAGQTDRFRAIVTHASLWALENFHGTTDLGVFWEREFGDPYREPARYRENSPNRHVGNIRTPMLVIHGEKDLRVPVSEGLILWTDLARNGVDARFLYFPDENHWVLKPQNARLGYETVLRFLGEHLLDEPFETPELL